MSSAPCSEVLTCRRGRGARPGGRMGGSGRGALADCRALTPEELVALSPRPGRWRSEAIRVTHPRLSALPLRAHLARCGRARHASSPSWTGRSPASPIRSAGRLTSLLGSMAMARLAGFHPACANFPGRVHRFSPTFALPRLVVRDWPGDGFRRGACGRGSPA